MGALPYSPNPTGRAPTFLNRVKQNCTMTIRATTKLKATEADKIIGERVKEIRERKGVTHMVLGKAIGVSFQQIQKYERGISRIIASRLFDISIALEVPITTFFYEECPNEEEELTMVWNTLPHGQIRKQFIALMQAIGKLA